MAEIKSGYPSNFEKSPWATPVRAVIFDMDGLMIDSEVNHFVAFRIALRPLEVDLTEDQHKEINVGKSDLEGSIELARRYHLIDPIDGHEVTPEELTQRKQAAYDAVTKGKKPVMQPGLIDLLKELKANGFKMAVASGSAKHEIKAVIDALGLQEYFGDHYYSAEEVERGKPAPDLFSYAADQLGVANTECLVLEDANSGLKAAAKAHMHRYVIPSRETVGATFGNAYRIIHGLDRVMGWLHQDSPGSFKEDSSQIA